MFTHFSYKYKHTCVSETEKCQYRYAQNYDAQNVTKHIVSNVVNEITIVLEHVVHFPHENYNYTMHMIQF